MPKNKMIKKRCPKCLQQAAVASKSCRCGHSFFMARSLAQGLAVIAPATAQGSKGVDDSEGIGEGIVKRRRTERVKREKPNYYDALEYDKQIKKLKRTRNRSTGSTESSIEQHLRKDESKNKPQLKRKRGRVKVERDTEEEIVMTAMSPMISIKCGVILAEINRRIGSSSWRL